MSKWDIITLNLEIFTFFLFYTKGCFTRASARPPHSYLQLNSAPLWRFLSFLAIHCEAILNKKAATSRFHILLLVCIYSNWCNSCKRTSEFKLEWKQLRHNLTTEADSVWSTRRSTVRTLSLISKSVQTAWALHPENSETCPGCWCIECCTEAQTQNHARVSRINNPVIPQPVKIIKCSTLLDSTLLLTHAILLVVLVQEYNQLL